MEDNVLINDEIKLNKRLEKLKTILNAKTLVLKVALAIGLGYLVLTYCFGLNRMSGTSMAPNISDGDLIISYKIDKIYNRGDIVTFNKYNKRFVLRVVAIEGDVVDINEDKELLINNHVENNKVYYSTIIPEESSITYPYPVKSGEVFVVGDYRYDTYDSRTFGGINTQDIEGKVLSILRTKDI